MEEWGARCVCVPGLGGGSADVLMLLTPLCDEASDYRRLRLGRKGAVVPPGTVSGQEVCSFVLGITAEQPRLLPGPAVPWLLYQPHQTNNHPDALPTLLASLTPV